MVRGLYVLTRSKYLYPARVINPPGLGFVLILCFSPMKSVGHGSEFVYFLSFQGRFTRGAERESEIYHADQRSMYFLE